MDKKELYQYVGSMQQLAYIRKITCEEGRSTGLRMFDVKNECLRYQVMCDKWNGNLHKLKPFEKEKNELVFTVLDGEEIQAETEKFKKIFN